MLLFNEIDFKKMTLKEYFNTSNVTIQPAVMEKVQETEKDFNTSNVTIQQHLLQPRKYVNNISIHLMLLFNSGVQQMSYINEGFQYI